MSNIPSFGNPTIAPGGDGIADFRLSLRERAPMNGASITHRIMALEKITSVSGKGVYVPGSDIDTDRIIPARFMKCVTFDGLG